MYWSKQEYLAPRPKYDTTSSKKYNYYRINEVISTYIDEEGQEITVYTYDECKVEKENWEFFLNTIHYEEDLNDLADAIEILTNVVLEG